MKILHVAYFGRFGKVTGICEAVMNMVRHQQQLGHQVKVLIPFSHPSVDNKTVFFTCSLGYGLKFIKDYAPDIVVFDGLYDKYQIRLSFYLKANHLPYVLVFHGGASSDNAKKNALKKKVANYLLFNRFVKWAERVVYLSENEKRKSIFNKQNPNDAIIPNGVTLPANVELRKLDSKIRIIFLSRLDWYGKGLDVLCDAIRQLSDKGYTHCLEFCFYGPKENPNCERLFEYGTLSVYGGYVTGEKKNEAFRNADIFILPSRSEGMPVTVLEALSYGVPCIVTPETNMAELIEINHCGWVVSLSASDICNTIEQIVAQFEQQRSRLFVNCIKTAKSFDWNVIAEQSIDLYKEILLNNNNNE